ncbi:MAG: hypothetical protein R3F49_20130 [Planctomycetota bacterium]
MRALTSRVEILGGLVLGLWGTLGVAAAQLPPPAEETPATPAPATPAPAAVSYWREVRPLLAARCAGCHQPARALGGHVLTEHRRLLAAAEDDGPLVYAGRPDDSALLEVVLGFEGAPPSMPKGSAPLTDAEVSLLRRWIAAGAQDDSPPRVGPEVSPEHPPVYEQPPVLTSLAWSPDGALLAVSGYHETLLLDGIDLHLVARLVGLSERIESLAFSPDGAHLAVAGGAPAQRGELQVWDVAARRLTVSVQATYDCLFGASWSPDGHLIAFGGADKAVRAIDAKSGAQVLFNGAHDDWVLGTAFTLDSGHVVSVSRDRSMKLVQVSTQQFIDDITSITPGVQKGGLMAVVRHPTRDELLIGGADGVPRLYRAFREKARKIGDDFNLLRAFDALPGRVFGVAISADGARVAAGSSAGRSGEARAYRASDGAELWRHPTEGGVFTVAFSPDGATVAMGGYTGDIELLDAGTGALQRRVTPTELLAAQRADPSSEASPELPPSTAAARPAPSGQ